MAHCRKKCIHLGTCSWHLWFLFLFCCANEFFKQIDNSTVNPAWLLLSGGTRYHGQPPVMGHVGFCHKLFRAKCELQCLVLWEQNFAGVSSAGCCYFPRSWSPNTVRLLLPPQLLSGGVCTSCRLGSVGKVCWVPGSQRWLNRHFPLWCQWVTLGSSGPELCCELDDLPSVAAARCHPMRAAYSCQQLCVQCLGETNAQLSAPVVSVLRASTKSLHLLGERSEDGSSLVSGIFSQGLTVYHAFAALRCLYRARLNVLKCKDAGIVEQGSRLLGWSWLLLL